MATPVPLTLLSSCTPTSSARAWQSAPHPYLPLLATASSDRSVRIYSLTSFALLSTISGGHKRSIRTAAWKPGVRGDKESILATGSFDATAGIWKAQNARIEHDADIAGENEDNDDDDDDDLWRFDVTLEGHDSEIKSVAWSCHGTFLATCSRDKSVWIWETLEPVGGGAQNFTTEDEDNLETVAVLQEHDGDVKCVAWHPEEENCLASCSYDDMVRVWREDADAEWGCVGVGEGHTGTVWCVEWEPASSKTIDGLAGGVEMIMDDEKEDATAVSGPRLISCSDDMTVRLWRRRPKARPKQKEGPRIPSIIRSTSDEEEWFEEAQLPKRHERAVYAVAWSRRSRKVVTTGSDGRVVVYEEQPSKAEMNGSNTLPSTWIVTHELEAAHGVFEVNHVCWAKRQDRGKRNDEEEIIITTGDDGEVKIWTLDPI